MDLLDFTSFFAWTFLNFLARCVIFDSSCLFSVIVESDKGTGARRKTRVCDLDIKDQFWMSQKGSPFPLVAEKIEEELEDYRSKEDDIKRMKSDMGLEGHGTENDAALGLLSDNTQVLILKRWV